MNQFDNNILNRLKALESIPSLLQNIPSIHLSPFLSIEKLSQKFEVFYETKELADIEFIIGPNGDRIRAHQFVLALNDCHFNNNNNSNNNMNIDNKLNVITIDHIKRESFEELMNECYLKNEIHLTEDNIEDMTKLAKMCNNQRLKYKCNDFTINRVVSQCNALVVNAKNNIAIDINTINATFDIQNENNLNISNNAFKRPIEKSGLWKPITYGLSSSTPHKKIKLNIDESSDEDSSQVSSQVSEVDNTLNETTKYDSIENISEEEMKSFTDLTNSTSITTSITVSNDEIELSFDYEMSHLNEYLEQKIEMLNVCKCAFVPHLDGKSDSHLVAFCATTMAVVHDCDSNKLMARFESPNHKLCSVAFTLMNVEESDEQINILAVGSENRIYLCKGPEYKPYEEVEGYGDEVKCLVFHRDRRDWLFSSSLDQMIKILKIGSLYRENGMIRWKESAIIYKLKAHFIPLSMCYINSFDCLIASGESHDLLIFNKISTLKPIIGKAMVSKGNMTINSIAHVLNTDLIAIRSSFSERLTIANISVMIDRMMDNMNRQIYSPNPTYDNKQIISVTFSRWSQLIHSRPIKSTSSIYLAASSGIIGCGDHKGNVYLYDSNKIIKDNHLNACKVLEVDWPQKVDNPNFKPPFIVSVSISDDQKYIVSATDDNLVIVWKQKTVNDH